MIKKITLLMLMFTLTISAQNLNGSIDVAGDIMFIAYDNADDDGLAFLLLDQAPHGTSIRMTDEEWIGSAFNSLTSEGELLWQNNTGATIQAGTVIIIDNADGDGITVNIGTATENETGFTTSTGDQVIAFTGTRATPGTFLTSHGDENSVNSAETHTLSGTGLTNGANAFSTIYATGYYNGPTEFNGAITDVSAEISKSSNWVLSTFNPLFPNNVKTAFTGTAFSTATTPTVTTTSASSIGNTSAILGGNVTADGGATVSERGIVYSTSDTTPTIAEGATKDTNGSSTGVFFKAISGLAAGTLYYYNTYAINTQGTSYGTASSFTTTGKGWTGATNTDWATASNWSPAAIPLASDNLIIPNVTNKPIISASTGAVANNITIDTSSSVTLESGGSLIIEGTATVNGNFIYKVNVSDDKWHLVSSPVSDEQYDDTWNTANSIETNLPNEAVAHYSNTSDANGDWVYFQNGSTATTFGPGIGYSLKRTTSGNYTFTGTFPAAPINPMITIGNIGTGSENRWNLVGNPFPAHLNIGTFLSANGTPLTDTHENIYVWNASANAGAGEYQPLASGQLHPGQAFFVSSNLATTSITFTKAMQSDQNGVTFYKNTDPKISLIISDETNTKSTEITYASGMTTGLDPRYDVGTFTGQSASFNVFTHLVSHSEGVDFMKQALPKDNYENMIIPVGVKAASDKKITFTADIANLPDGLKVFLEDRDLNTFKRLDEANSNYKITLTDAANGIGRFYLHTSKNSVLNIDKSLAFDNISIYKLNTSTLRISGLSPEKTEIAIFNLLGKKVFYTSFTANGIRDVALPNLSMGVYSVKLKNNSGKLNKKIILE